MWLLCCGFFCFFFFNDTATTEIYTLSLHDALPISVVKAPLRAANLPIGVFPASRGPRVLPRLAELFPAVRPCADALDVALTNAGPVIHPPLVLLNTGPALVRATSREIGRAHI